MTDVSVIIPAYNRLWCLPGAIDSCRNTACKTEIIVVDDGSTDGTWEWLTEQQGLVIVKQNHLGKCWAVNNGFEIANGKYIKFLDSDDRVTEGSIDKQFEIAEKNLSDIVVSGYILVDEKNSQIKNQDWIECDDFIAQQLGECDSSHYSAYLFKKLFINDIPHRPDYSYRDDRLFVLEAALKHPKVAIYKGYSLLHTQHQKSRLQVNYGLQQTVQDFQHLNIYRIIIGQLKQTNELTVRRLKAAENILWPLCHWIAKVNISEAVAILQWIKELDPAFKIPEDGILGFMYNKIGFKMTEKMLRFRRVLKHA